MKRVLISALMAFALIAGAAVALAAVPSEKTACASATASTPDHVLGVDGGSVYTIPGDTATDTQCVTVTADTVTVPGPTTTVTETVTVGTTTAPPTTTSAPPPPPPNNCTKTAVAGADLSSFLGTLSSGDVGCLHGGEYSDGCAVSWSLDATSRSTVRSYPGETATLHTSLGLAGDNLTAAHLKVEKIPASCGGDMSGFTAQGANDEFLYNRVIGDGLASINPAGDVTRHGFLTNTSASNTTIHGNYVEGTGSECNLDHGVYFQKSGRITRNVFKNIVCGYGIHLYSGPSNVVVSGNTSVGSKVRAGILISCSSNCIVVNNIFAGNAGYGIAFRACSSGCVVDNNITWQNGSGSVGDSLASQATNTRNVDPQFIDAELRVAASSPAVNTGRTEYAFYPDRDEMPAVGLPDLGAYER